MLFVGIAMLAGGRAVTILTLLYLCLRLADSSSTSPLTSPISISDTTTSSPTTAASSPSDSTASSPTTVASSPSDTTNTSPTTVASSPSDTTNSSPTTVASSPSDTTNSSPTTVASSPSDTTNTSPTTVASSPSDSTDSSPTTVASSPSDSTNSSPTTVASSPSDSTNSSPTTVTSSPSDSTDSSPTTVASSPSDSTDSSPTTVASSPSDSTDSSPTTVASSPSDSTDSSPTTVASSPSDSTDSTPTTVASSPSDSTDSSPTTVASSPSDTTTMLTSPKPIPPLSFVNVSMVVALNVMETQNIVLDRIVCEDINNDPLKVGLVSVDPRTAKCANCFQIMPCAPEWCLKLIPNVGKLDIKTDPVYTLTIACENSKGYKITWVTEIRLTTNSPPLFNHSSSVVALTVVDTRNKKNGDVIFTVLATDVDNDTLRYTMTTSPDNGNFRIGEYDGVIRAASDLSRECSPAVTFQVFVSDGINPLVGPLIVSTSLNDVIITPSITNMGHSIQVREVAKPGDIIYTIAVVQDPASTISYTLITSPSQAYSLFKFSNNDIELASVLDYENPIGGRNSISLMVTAVDAGGCSSDAKTLTIEVTDVNEPPRFVPSYWVTTVYEGRISVYPLWRVEDPDINDIATFSIKTTTTEFTIDSVTGEISSIGVYDVDGNRPKYVELSIMVADRQGLNSTGTIRINFLDANDNLPIITSALTAFDANECMAVGTRLATLSVKDADSSFQGNNVVDFLVQNSKYFTVTSAGQVILSSPIRSGEYSSASVSAVDRGKYPMPLKSAPVFVVVRGIPCPTTTVRTTTTTTTTTTTPSTTTPITTTQVSSTTLESIPLNNFLTVNLPWIMVSAVMCSCLLGLITFFVCKFGRSACRRVSPPQSRFTEPLMVRSTPPAKTDIPPPTVESPPEPRQPSPFIVSREELKPFDFWSGGSNDKIPI